MAQEFSFAGVLKYLQKQSIFKLYFWAFLFFFFLLIFDQQLGLLPAVLLHYMSEHDSQDYGSDSRAVLQ